MKPCSKCGDVKPLDAFYRDRRKRDGRASECKACKGLSNTARERANPDRVKARTDRQRELHPEKRRARLIVTNAVRDGEIVKPTACERCNASAAPDDLHAHHEDYSEPRRVEWLCRDCHNDLHR